MKCFELTCTAYLKRDISYSMAQDEKLKTLHKEIGFKHYTFDNFYPIQRDGIYKEGNIYQITFQSIII